MIKLIFIIISCIQLNAGLCRYHIKKVEEDLKIPPDTLAAIGNVESGKYSSYRKQKEPWPWTVYSNGKSNFFKTKTQAERYINKLIDEGEKNIDIGCMQINWNFHNKNFKSIGDMLNPRKNIEYAGKLIKNHYKNTHDWEKAIGNYHSKTPEFHKKYLKKIELAQNDIKKYKLTKPKKAPRFKPWRPFKYEKEKRTFFSLNSAKKSKTWMKYSKTVY